jgi:hypothetical protein
VLTKKILFDKSYLFLIITAFCILLYFSLAIAPRGDEGDPYLKAFNQAYINWPRLDTSPAWSLSSPYLWLVAGFHTLLQSICNLDIITSGRILSLTSWSALALVFLREEKVIRWKASIVLFNPYLLIYATRAHPLAPALLMIYFFWKGVQNKSRLWGVFILIAVTFQVFTGGVAAMLLPDSVKNINYKSLSRAILGGLFALGGVFFTWLTWGGGMYPEAFENHQFFEIHHKNGTLSFGYISLAYMITGGIMWIIGDKKLSELFTDRNQTSLIVILLSLSALVLYYGKQTTGVVDTLLAGLFPLKIAKFAHVFVFTVLGMGWLRISRDWVLLTFGVLGSAILMATLPYLYERIAFFGVLSPILIWVLLGHGKTETVYKERIALFCILFACLASIYQIFGVL